MTCLPGIERRGSLSGGRAGPPRFSASVLHNQLVYVAGQIASDASQDYADQARQVLHLVEECLTAAGTSKAQLLKVSSITWAAQAHEPCDDRSPVFR